MSQRSARVSLYFSKYCGVYTRCSEGTAKQIEGRSGKHASTTMELLLGKHVPAATVTHATGITKYCRSSTFSSALEGWL
jgi:hypothetical protein